MLSSLCYTSPVQLFSMANLLATTKDAYTRASTLYPSQMRIVRFVISGGTATTVNLSILYVLTHFLGVWYLYSSIMAFAASFFVSFTLQKFWTFGDASRHRMRAQAFTYLLIILFALLINTTLLFIFVEMAHLHYLVAQFISGLLIAVINFFSYKHIVFKKRVDTTLFPNQHSQ